MTREERNAYMREYYANNRKKIRANIKHATDEYYREQQKELSKKNYKKYKEDEDKVEEKRKKNLSYYHKNKEEINQKKKEKYKMIKNKKNE